MSSRNTYDAKVSKRSSNFRHEPGKYDYNGIAHWWAYNYGSMSTAGDRMSTSGNRIYSYGTVIARMFDPPAGQSSPLVLITKQHYSTTTSKHVGAVRSAVSHMNYILVSDPDPYGKTSHIANLAAMLNHLEDLGESYQRKRLSHTKHAVFYKMRDIKSGALLYGEYFKLRNTKEYKRILKYILPGEQGFEEFVRVLPEERRKREAKDNAAKIRAARKAHKADYDKAQERLKLWLNGDDTRPPNPSYLDEVYLRVKGGVIETTEGAIISVSSATKAYLTHKRGHLTKGMHVGPYTFDGIDENNNAHIGCHTISMDKINAAVEVILAEREAHKENAEIDRRKLLDEQEREEEQSLDVLFSELKDLMSDMEESDLLSEFSGILKEEE